MSRKISEKLALLHYIEKTSDQETWMKKLNPQSKVLMTILFLVILMSFPKYEILGTAGMVLYPTVLFTMERISFKKIIGSLGPVLFVLILFGSANLLFDRTVIQAGVFGRIPGGAASFVTLIIKGILAVLASFILVSTTRIEEICYGLQSMRVPKIICIQIMLMFRYLSVILNEAQSMNEAYHLRAPGQKGINRKVWGSFLGQLLLRSLDRAELIYESMMLRGFRGEFKMGGTQRLKYKEIGFLIAWTISLLSVRMMLSQNGLNWIF